MSLTVHISPDRGISVQTFPIKDAVGLTFAVEVENAYIGPRSLADVLRGINGVSSVRLRSSFSASPDVHVVFAYYGKPFIVIEPF